MRFAILGDHPDGWAVGRALLASGRHELVVYQGDTPLETAREISPAVRRQADLEEILADPQVEVVIVAAAAGTRLDVLRRVLQSERSALCVHPVDRKPDGGHEINLLQGDLHQVVLPILPDAVAPGLVELHRAAAEFSPTERRHMLVDVEFGGKGDVLFPDRAAEWATFPGWTLLRRLGGEIAEVEALADGEAIAPGEPVIVQGRFLDGGLFRVLYRSGIEKQVMDVVVRHAAADLSPKRERGEAPPSLARRAQICGDYAAIAQRFEAAIAELPHLPRAAPGAGRSVADPGVLSWMDEVRALELDDAARRSVERRRASTLDYQEASEEVGFKGTMTLVGCGLLWGAVVLLILSVWFPSAGKIILPVSAVFLLLQFLRWFLPPKNAPSTRR
jgi:hypothetical protein